MAGLTISQAALQVGVNSSAIRYYERIGLLPRAHRVGGQRRYDSTEVDRLTVIRRARQLGFTLEEVRRLCQSGLESQRPARGGPAERWRSAVDGKLAEIDLKIAEMKELQGLLKGIADKCHCQSIEECGRRMRAKRAESDPSPARS